MQHRANRRDSRDGVGCRRITRAWPTTVMAMLTAAAGVLANPALGAMITGLRGTGTDYDSSTATRDSHWRIVSLPYGFTSGSSTPPFDAWIFTGSVTSGSNVPNAWLGGTTNSGTNGYHWIGVRRNNATSLLPAPGVSGTSYSVIYATDFFASAAGQTTLSLSVSVDNRGTFFVNGSITGTNTNNPTITGGTQIGNVIYNDPPTVDGATKAFTVLQTASGTTHVTQGWNTLYAVVEDVANSQGTYGFTGLLVAVPEPSTAVMMLSALALGGWRMSSRRRPRDSHDRHGLAG